MNYIGSKFKLLTFLHNGIESTLYKAGAKLLQDSIFCDMFAGSGAVGRFFKGKVKQLIANDREYYSYVLNQNYIATSIALKGAEEFFKELDSELLTPPVEGKIYQHYCMGEERFGEAKVRSNEEYKRQYFSDYNGAKIDAIRQKIESWRCEERIDDRMYFHLLASLLESADRVANTASVYGAFLKALKPSAQKKLILAPASFECDSKSHRVFRVDSNELIGVIAGDILYLDPPYNAREYGANYHLLNTLALYDDFTPKGKTGLREYTKSAYCKKSEVAGALDSLVSQANFEWIFLSYNDEGLLGLDNIKDIFEKYGEYSFVVQKHQRFKADSTRIQKQDYTLEYLHILRKSPKQSFSQNLL